MEGGGELDLLPIYHKWTLELLTKWVGASTTTLHLETSTFRMPIPSVTLGLISHSYMDGMILP